MNLGYIRVSSRDQNEGRQLEKMRALGIEERFIFVDKQSGKNFDRPRYNAMKDVAREGDLIFMDALDRLGRDYDGIIAEWKDLTRNVGVDIVVLENEALFDSRKFRELGDVGKLMEDQFLALLSFVAEQERKKILTRQREGIELARKEGRPYGRPKIVISEKQLEVYRNWQEGEITAVEAMKQAGLKPNTFYLRAKELGLTSKRC